MIRVVKRAEEEWAGGCCASGGWRRRKELKTIELYVKRDKTVDEEERARRWLQRISDRAKKRVHRK